MNNKNKRKNLIYSFSLPESYHQRMQKMAAKMDIYVSDFLRRTVDFYEDEYNKKLYGRYGGIQVAQSKQTKLMKDEQAAQIIEMIKNAPADEVSEYLIRIGYLDQDQDLGNKIRTYRLRDEESGRVLYQIDLDENNKEIYKRSIFTIDELISDLKKSKKI